MRKRRTYVLQTFCVGVADKLSGILEHADASKFADKLFDLTDGFKGSSRHSRSSRKRKVRPAEHLTRRALCAWLCLGRSVVGWLAK